MTESKERKIFLKNLPTWTGGYTALAEKAATLIRIIYDH